MSYIEQKKSLFMIVVRQFPLYLMGCKLKFIQENILTLKILISEWWVTNLENLPEIENSHYIKLNS